MSRKNARSFENAWLLMIDSTEKNLINLVQQPEQLLQRLKAWRQAGLLSHQARASLRQLQQLTHTGIARNQPITQLEEYQQLVGQLTPTLERITQRLNAQGITPATTPADESLEVALRVAEKRRAERSE